MLRQAVALALTGISIGLLVSWTAAPRVQPLLFESSGRSWAVYATAAATLLLAAAVAGSFPAWRATRVDPREALLAD